MTYKPRKLTTRQLKSCGAVDGFRMRFPGGGVYYFIRKKNLIKVFRLAALWPNTYKIAECVLGTSCIPYFVDVVLPYMHKRGWFTSEKKHA